MGTLLRSPMRVTMDGTVLLGFGDFVPDGAEPETTWQIDGESVKRPRAAFAKQFIFSPNAENRLSFECVRMFPGEQQAQTFRLGLLAALPDAVHDVLIETLASGNFTLAGARLEGPVNPAVRDVCRVQYKCTLVGGAVTAGGEPDYDLLGDVEPLTS